MHPTLFTIGKVSIPTYTVLLDLGLILGLIITYFEGKRKLGSAETALDLGLWTVIGGIVGGRIGYVLANLKAFSENWAQVVQIWRGGLSFHGAFLGGFLVLLAFTLIRRQRRQPICLWQLADVLTPGLALGLVFGWAACLMGGCSYGTLGTGFGHMILPDIYGIEASRFATQLFGLAQAGLLFIVFWILRNRWPFAGTGFLLFCLLYFGGQFFVELTRGDEAIYVGALRLAQLLDLVLVLAAAAALIALWWRARQQGLEESAGPDEFEEFEEDEAAVEAARSDEALDGEDVVDSAVSEEAGESEPAPESDSPDETDILG